MMSVMDEQAQDVGGSEEARQAATGRDASGDAATSRDDYVSLREAREMFLSQGRPVTDRTLQRSCKKQHFSCKKIATADGEKWFALKSSVLNRIAELDEFDRLREQHDDATSRDAARQVAPKIQGDASPDIERPVATRETSPAVDVGAGAPVENGPHPVVDGIRGLELLFRKESEFVGRSAGTPLSDNGVEPVSHLHQS